MSYDPSQVAFIDVETTGLDPETDAIWEIAVIVDGHEIVWQQLLTDRQVDNVHPKAAEINGFHDRYDPPAAYTPSASIRRFMHLVGDRHLVGACPWFDSERLHRLILGDVRRSLPRALPWHYHLIDIENLAIGYLRGIETSDCVDVEFDTTNLPWRSRELSLMLGVDTDDFQPAHTALADARWAKAIYEVVMGSPKQES